MAETKVEVVTDSTGKRIEKPNREEFDKAIGALDAEIKRNHAIIEEVNAKLDKLKAEKEAREKGEKPTNNPDQEKLQQLRAATKALGEQRKVLIEQAKKTQTARDKARTDFDEARKKIREANVPTQEALDKKIRDLEFYMTTTSLTLKEEKQCMSDIRNLNSKRSVFGEHDAVKAAKEKAEAAAKESQQKVDDIKAAYDKARSEEEAFAKTLVEKRENRPKSEVPGLIAKRDAARAELNRLYPEVKKLREEFKAKNDVFMKMLQEKRKEQQRKYKEEQEKYKEEQKVRMLQKQEESFETMHGLEFAAIDQLSTYLKNIQKAEAGEEKEEEAAAAAPVEENLIGKYANAIEDDIFGTKKAGKAKAKKKAPKKKTGGLVHDYNLMLEFNRLKLSAPLTSADIPTALEALEAKRAELKKDKDAQYAKFLVRKAAIEAGQADPEAPPPAESTEEAGESKADGEDKKKEKGDRKKKGKKEGAKTDAPAEAHAAETPAAVEAAV